MTKHLKLIIPSIFVYTSFVGTNHLAHLILPKYIDIIIGFPLSFYIIIKSLNYFHGVNRTNNCR